MPQLCTPHHAVTLSVGDGLPVSSESATCNALIFNSASKYEQCTPSLTNCSVQRRGFTMAPSYFQVPPAPKYGGNSETEPFEDWLEQWYIAFVCY